MFLEDLPPAAAAATATAASTPAATTSTGAAAASATTHAATSPAARGPVEATAATTWTTTTAATESGATTATEPRGRAGPLEVLDALLPPLPGGEITVQGAAVEAGAGARHRTLRLLSRSGRGPGPLRRPGASRGPISSFWSGPLAALALLKVPLVVALVDLAVSVGQDVVLASRRPDSGLSRPGRLGRPGFSPRSGGLSRTTRTGGGTLSHPLTRTAGSYSASGPGARLAGAGG